MKLAQKCACGAKVQISLNHTDQTDETNAVAIVAVWAKAHEAWHIQLSSAGFIHSSAATKVRNLTTVETDQMSLDALRLWSQELIDALKEV